MILHTFNIVIFAIFIYLIFELIKSILKYLEADVDYLLHQLEDYHQLCLKNGNYIEAKYITTRAIPNVERMKANKLYHLYMIIKREPLTFLLSGACIFMVFLGGYYMYKITILDIQ